MTTSTISHSWAPWWTPEQVSCFLTHTTKIVQARYGAHTINEAEGTVSISNNHCVLGLSNLAQTCRALDPEQWRLAIYSHVARLEDFSPDILAERLSNYEQVREDLRVRIVGPQHLSHVDAVGDPLPLGLFASLSVDLNGACCPIDRSYLNSWDVPQATAMQVGLKNTLTQEPLNISTDYTPQEKFLVFSGDSLFASGHLLDFCRLLPDVGALGAVVAVPTAQMVIACPVLESNHFVDASAAMLAASYLFYLDGPNSVSPNALWWRPEHPLAPYARLDSHAFELVAPVALQERLRELSEVR
ncbi:MAG: hypothetical protein OXE04_04500 [bacterium]|nr:hypothetical protein [bacterium]